MNNKFLPTSTIINNKEIKFVSDYRDILEIFKILNDPDLLDGEKVMVSLENFYETDDYLDDTETAILEMFKFITNSDLSDEKDSSNKKPLYDWEQDFNLIVSPINKIVGYDVRGVEYLHWWTFLSAFMDIGDCTFSTFVGIRDKMNKGKKLDKSEEIIYKENRSKITLKKKYDSTTQALLDEIMGREN